MTAASHCTRFHGSARPTPHRRKKSRPGPSRKQVSRWHGGSCGRERSRGMKKSVETATTGNRDSNCQRKQHGIVLPRHQSPPPRETVSRCSEPRVQSTRQPENALVRSQRRRCEGANPDRIPAGRDRGREWLRKRRCRRQCPSRHVCSSPSHVCDQGRHVTPSRANHGGRGIPPMTAVLSVTCPDADQSNWLQLRPDPDHGLVVLTDDGVTETSSSWMDP